MSHATTKLDEVEKALRQLPDDRLDDVLLFIEFLTYQGRHETRPALDWEQFPAGDDSEDEALWAAVEANRRYKAQHPDEMEIHESGADFLAATSDG